MANRGGCTNGTLNSTGYSSPVPVIGLYVAAASFGCLVVMVYDVVVSGILSRKPWLPCKYFSLNSLTLALLTVSTKLTVDLTSEMPGHWDQLAKLTGTAFMCICMGFLAPSLGANGDLTNMLALTILVVTISVNISIQLYTGVIFLFFVQHIAILGLMLLLLLMLWQISLSIKSRKRSDAMGYMTVLTKGECGLLERLKICYLHAYYANPQFNISLYPMSIAISTICTACATITVEALVRSLVLNELEACQGVSDYSWSMPIIVIIQIVTVILVVITIIARSVAMFNRTELGDVLLPFFPDDKYVKRRKKTTRAKGMSFGRLLNLLGSTITNVVLIVQLLMVLPLLLVSWCFPITRDDNRVNGFGLRLLLVSSKYVAGKCLDEMVRLKAQVSRSMTVYRPSQFLCRLPPKDLNLPNMKIERGSTTIEVSTVSMVGLVKLAEASLPTDLLRSLLSVFHKAKEVTDYIDKAMPPTTLDGVEALAYVNKAWIGGDFTCLLPGDTQPATDHTTAIATIERFKFLFDLPFMRDELRNLQDFICDFRRYSSIVEVCEVIEQLFADLLHGLFAKLPLAIFKHLSTSSPEEFEENAKVAIKLLFKIGTFEAQNNWLFPPGMSGILTENLSYPESLRALREIVPVHISHENTQQSHV